jgi:HK97 family phage major capsid protein
MKMTEREYLAKRAVLLDEGRKLNDLTENEARDFTPEEKTAWDKVQADVKVLDGIYERSKVLGEPDNGAIKPAKAPAHLRLGLGDSFGKGLGAFLRDGDMGGVRNLMVGPNEIQIRASNNTDMNIGTPADGGYVDPTGMHNQVMAKRSELSLPEKVGVQRIPGKGTTVNVPYDNETDGEFVSTGEGSSFDQDAPAIGQAAMTLVKYSKYITLSVELLEDEDAALMTFLANWIGRGQAKTLNSLLLTEVAASGTAYKTTASATAIAAGEPEAVVLNDYLGDYYDDSGSVNWIMRPLTFGTIAAITGNPRLYAQTPAGKFERELLQYPVWFSSKAGAITSAQKSAYFGNWNYVGWREAPGFTMLRDPYSAAGTGQVKLWMYFRTVFKVLQPYAVGYLLQAT